MALNFSWYPGTLVCRQKFDWTLKTRAWLYLKTVRECLEMTATTLQRLKTAVTKGLANKRRWIPQNLPRIVEEKKLIDRAEEGVKRIAAKPPKKTWNQALQSNLGLPTNVCNWAAWDLKDTFHYCDKVTITIFLSSKGKFYSSNVKTD